MKDFFKDEVRSLGKSLGLVKQINFKHPFPGPGLGIRIVGNITKERIKILQESDNIFINELIKSLKFNNSYKLPSMCSAFYGYFGYETIHYVENISIKKKKDDLKLPNSILFLPKFIIVFDNKELKITIK